MIFRLILPVVLLAVPLSPRPFADCETGCQTTVVVQDCEGAVVAGAKVKIKLCCGNEAEISSSTNEHGEAAFNYCAKDICRSEIALQGFALLSFDGNSCTKNGKSSRCTIQVCKR